ncbi:Reverse transcriptase [Ceratobasidium sp. AG-Ba]|nr:Reverse transcriptase [Ceratobasidium sp. AG-Ba]
MRDTGTGGDLTPIKAKLKDEAESPATPMPFNSVQSTTTVTSPTISSLLEPLESSSTTHTTSSKPPQVVRTSSKSSKSSGANSGAKMKGPSTILKPGAIVQTRTACAGQPVLRLISTRGPPEITILNDKGNLTIATHTGSQLIEDSAAKDNEDTETANMCLDDPYADMPPLKHIYALKHTMDLPPLVPIPQKQLHCSQDLLTATFKAKENAFTSAFYGGFTHQTFMTQTNPEGDNPSYKDAMNRPQRNKWIQAMQEEYDQLVRMKTFELANPPINKNIIQNKWVLNCKRDENGNIACYKARLVAKGFTQIPGQDFYNTLLRSPTLTRCISCALLLIAFLNGELNKELYMRQIPGFDNGLGTVLHLRQSLYGLKQAGHFNRKQANRTLVLWQSAYIVSIVDEAGLLGAYPADTPASTSTQLERNTGPKPNYPYARILGRLMCAAICTRPNIAHIVNHLASFTTCYGQPHVTALKRVIRYLAVGYSNADWGSSLLNRKSISGNCFLLGGASVSWSSKKQPTVALSTMEAEYMALAHASTQALWIRQLFDEISMPSSSPTLILSDNLAALTISVESQYRGQSKHINIRHHFIRDCVEKRLLSPMYVNTKDNFADALTKPLPVNQFHILMEGIMGEQEEHDIEII